MKLWHFGLSGKGDWAAAGKASAANILTWRSAPEAWLQVVVLA